MADLLQTVLGPSEEPQGDNDCVGRAQPEILKEPFGERPKNLRPLVDSSAFWQMADLLQTVLGPSEEPQGDVLSPSRVPALTLQFRSCSNI